MGINARSPIERGLNRLLPFTIVRHKVVGDHGHGPNPIKNASGPIGAPNPIRNRTPNSIRAPNSIGNPNPIGNINNG